MTFLWVALPWIARFDVFKGIWRKCGWFIDWYLKEAEDLIKKHEGKLVVKEADCRACGREDLGTVIRLVQAEGRGSAGSLLHPAPLPLGKGITRGSRDEKKKR